MKNKTIWSIFFAVIIFLLIVVIVAIQFFNITIGDIFLSIALFLPTLFFFLLSGIFNINETKIAQAPEKTRKRNYWGYVFLPLFFIATVTLCFLIYHNLLFEYGYFLIIVWIALLIVIITLSNKARKSFSKTQKPIIEPEWFWRLIFNVLPIRFETSEKDRINVLVIYSNDSLKQKKRIEKNYKNDDILRVIFFDGSIYNQKDLKKLLKSRQIFGIYILYSDEIKNSTSWIENTCEDWTAENKEKPIVYANFTDEPAPLHYGKVSSKEYANGLWRLFQRSYNRSDLWKQQSQYFHRFSMGILFFLLVVIAVLFIDGRNKTSKITPAEVLATTYFENFITPTCRYILENGGFKTNDSTTYKNCEVKIIIPDKINEDVNNQFEILKKDYKTETTSFKYNGRHRNVIVVTIMENNTLQIIDFPTILSGINHVLKNHDYKGYVDQNSYCKKLRKKELNRFISKLQSLIKQENFEKIVSIEMQQEAL